MENMVERGESFPEDGDHTKIEVIRQYLLTDGYVRERMEDM